MLSQAILITNRKTKELRYGKGPRIETKFWVVVGYLGPLDPMLVNVQRIMGRRVVAGSLIGGIAETQELLGSYGKHKITSDIEIIKI